MDATEQVLATGGASGIAGLVLFILYKLFTNKARVKSSCCGKVVEIETGATTPRLPENINPMLENGRKPKTNLQDCNSDSSQEQSSGTGRTSGTSSQNQGDV